MNCNTCGDAIDEGLAEAYGEPICDCCFGYCTNLCRKCGGDLVKRRERMKAARAAYAPPTSPPSSSTR